MKEKYGMNQPSLSRISHGWDNESLEAKARWFQSLPLEERMRIFDEFTEMILELNPSIMHRRPHAQQTSARIRVLT